MTRPNETLVLATGNMGKVRELSDLFREVPLKIKSLADFEQIEDVEETGSTFEQNAILKAQGFARQTGYISIADDSGLEVDALEGAPGVLSARFAGADAGYDVKIPKLLAMLDATEDELRLARFACVMAIADPDGRVLHTAHGICTGAIARSPRGANGFGYDPIFVPDGYDQTFGELGDEVKSQISHRARAARVIIRYLLDFTGV